MIKPTNGDLIRSGTDILIPSWNNLYHLVHCVRSIRANSRFEHNVFVYLNQATEKEKAAMRDIGVVSISSSENRGICEAVNVLFKTFATKRVCGYVNDDMYFAPGWDFELANGVDRYPDDDLWMFCPTMVEPTGKNPNCLIRDFGRHLSTFDARGFKAAVPELKEKALDRITTWPPSFFPFELFQDLEYDTEYFPGFGHDPDFVYRMLGAGGRMSVAIGRSLVYHFSQVTTKRVRKKNRGDEVFVRKHGMRIQTFVEALGRGNPVTPADFEA